MKVEEQVAIATSKCAYHLLYFVGCHKQGLEALQNRAARIVARTVRSNPAIHVLKWPTLEERLQAVMCRIYYMNCAL